MEEFLHEGPCTFECDDDCEKRATIHKMVTEHMGLNVYLHDFPGLTMLIEQLDRTNLRKTEELWKLKQEFKKRENHVLISQSINCLNSIGESIEMLSLFFHPSNSTNQQFASSDGFIVSFPF